MLEKTLGIVLHIIPYNDKISVAHLYTEQYGRSSYLIPQGGGKKARMFRSLFMPFSILELDIDYRNSRELQKIIEARTVLPLQNIYSDPVKNAEALFLSEVLCQTIKEPEPNLPLFAFIARSIQVLNIMEEGKANFHLCFLLQLCSFLGFSPNMETYRTGYFFDMLNGIFSPSRPIHTYTLDARVQKLALSESDRLSKLVPDKVTPDKKHGETPFDFVYKESPELAAERESPNQLIRNTLKYAEKLEGSIRQTGVHACGVIIGQDDLENFAPMAIAKDAELNVVEFEGKEVESVGLIKMDFLGLRTLSIIKDAVENVKAVHGVDVAIDDIPLDDAPTYEVFARGDTTGLFQFESPGMKKHLRNLKPNRFEDLIAMNALYRPGPMEYIPNFIARKHGQEPVTYEIADMEEYLSDTYGITVYQEQVMLLSQKLAGFTGGEADTLRKAMGKKKRDVLDKMKPKFINGCKERGHDEKICDKIWGDWEAFASYAFNKSHSTCYAYVAYQTGYLKAHYPSEFMAALLSRNLADIKQLTLYMNECKRMGIRVLGPDINESMRTFSSNKSGDVRFGLGAVKGVGEAAVESIIAERNANGRFKDIYDLMERVNFTAVNRKCFENLAYAGGFDSISGFHRGKFFGADARDNTGITFIEQLMRYGQRFQAEKNNAQQSLFGGGGQVDIQRPVLPACADWTQLETLAKEREMIGLYLSAHPLDDYKVIINHMCKTQLTELENLEPFKGQEIAVAGMVVSVQNLMTKTGKPWGKFVLEDYNGTHEFALFGKDYENFRKYLFADYFLFIRGRVQPKPYNDKELEFKIISMVQLSEMRDTMIKEMHVQLPVQEVTQELIRDLSERVREARGETLFRVNVYDRDAHVSLSLFSKSYKVSLTQSLVGYLEDNDIKYSIA